MNKIIKVIFIDFLGVFIGILNGFLLPKFLTLESYSLIKTFALYASYSGVFHIGFSDGLYIILGGKNINEIKQNKIKGYLIALMKILTITLGIMAIVSVLFVKDYIFSLFIIYTIPFQITLFQSLILRATGQFDKYVKTRIIINVFNLISTLIIMATKSPYSYMIIQILGYSIISIIFLVDIFKEKNKKNEKNEKIKLKEIKYIINIGFIVMIANTITNLFFSLDRWFVKILFSSDKFAYYSFGVSMLNLFITLIGSISIVVYPYIAKLKNTGELFRVKKYIIIVSSIATSGFFVLEFIVTTFIPNYINSLSILSILIICIPFISIINILYSNLYKVNNMGKKYLRTSLFMLIIAVGLNICLVSLFNNIESIAYASLISLLIWYIYSARDFIEMRIKLNELVYLSINIISYVVLETSGIDSILKFIIYIIIIGIGLCIFYGEDLKYIAKLVRKKLIKN